MANSIKNEYIGYLLTRSDLINLREKLLIKELYVHLFELEILVKSLNDLSEKRYWKFDSLVGDRKCQARTSMMLDNVENTLSLRQVKNKIEIYFTRLNELINKVLNYSNLERHLLTKNLKELSLKKYLEQQDLTFEVPLNVKIIALSYLTSLSKQDLLDLSFQGLSSNKLDKILITAKVHLCRLSIKYEQELAQDYGCIQEQKILNKIETKGFCSMVSTFPGIKHILQKVKDKSQVVIKKLIRFCSCGGIKDKKIKKFQEKNNQLQHQSLYTIKDDQAIMAVEGYQFEGSFEQLKNILGVPGEATLIPEDYYKNCNCSQENVLRKIEDFEHAIIACLTQHPQYTTNSEIDFEGLGLLDSDVKKEYDYLKSLKGYSREDMSKFFAYHIYPSTVKEVLESNPDFEVCEPEEQVNLAMQQPTAQSGQSELSA